MTVIINETQEVKDLTIIDSNTNTEWTRDLLGNCDIHTDEEGNYHMDEADYEWWSTYIDGHLATEQEIESLVENIESIGYEFDEGAHRGMSLRTYIRQRVFDYMGQQDMENERDRAVQMLQEIAEEYGKHKPKAGSLPDHPCKGYRVT